ncbi:MAPEG family protein [Ponticoccus sp. SC2-23]|uniref:MAPEG family protein n=1 Tax=Alexandriicola marinus TaxID=2081710 RepID=UPI000FD82464|nr:MAPEG family protein [Alexandriicola marinus]MBM1220190.1 MAPEG family protein [Ponticoccus sp. SC6-9]MBM1224876.1 MAPEG family protein [Ponticoccus sp. SC6-15]MBM1228390.1 MAPEG family protein [Ponticoccus sp. SC6-38]MBM1233973.1 MAPEG family protein [Ponticoccus sp. SC6-45]MBM1238891.1 MAPEG family protein [Ponticoccus sp. SC6-49]MBM1242673.1 MAPEG family protein [Ponticoccus sp. SC2-64]MBM1247497.1 MAPEG family protein [Ponticoccus sp. SC6-42]MBM1251844.1 MAPEG family protein [Pontico
MTPELTALVFATLLQVVQFTIYSVLANRQVGKETALGPRDEPIHLKGYAGRAQRAMNNHFEGLTLFTIAAIVVSYADKGTGLTAACGWIYVAARALYVPAYIFALAPWRSLIWFVGFGATLLMLLSTLI